MPGIYVHIPFCRQACHYCNFHFSTSLRYKNEFVAALLREIQLVDDIVSPAGTLYLGGGTPSMLEAAELDTILRTIRDRFSWQPEVETTLEANPDDITVEKLQAWQAAGINRLSIGVQSFFNEDLEWMNRAHNSRQALESLELAQHYFSNITIDLIYGSPGLTDEKWESNLDTATRLGIQHLSCYALTVEPRTPLEKMIHRHQSPGVDNDQQSRQFLFLMHYLQEKGYEHYEISNFALPGHRSRHNSSYWKGENYIGMGPGAHSYNGSSRWWNIANNNQYIRSVNDGILPVEKEILTPGQVWNEYIMIRLRTMEGLDLEQLQAGVPGKADPKKESWLKDFMQTAKKYQESGHLIINGNSIVLTREGRLLADGIAADLFVTQ